MEITTKILDNTVISSFLKEITSVKVIQKCHYKLVTSKEVCEECEQFDKEFIKKFDTNLFIIDLNKNPLYLKCFSYLQSRYPYLHKGEISTFLLAFLNFHVKGKSYYLITDDKKMHQVISRLISDALFLKVADVKEFQNFKTSWTLGLLKRLYIHGKISEIEIDQIIEDLKKSTFFLSKEIISSLKNKNEP